MQKSLDGTRGARNSGDTALSQGMGETMKTVQEYGSELNAVCFAARKARETGSVWYAVECKYGWIDAERKPSLRFGKVWELHPDGTKHHS